MTREELDEFIETHKKRGYRIAEEVTIPGPVVDALIDRIESLEKRESKCQHEQDEGGLRLSNTPYYKCKKCKELFYRNSP